MITNLIKNPTILSTPRFGNQLAQFLALLIAISPFTISHSQVIPESGSVTNTSIPIPSITSDMYSSYKITGKLKSFFTISGGVQPLPAIDAPPLFISFDVIDFVEDANNTGYYHIPPDPIGAAGPNHVVAVVNTSIEWHTKTGTELSSQSLQSFFSPLSPQTGTFDPKVIYDQYAGRFLVVSLERIDNGDGDPSNISKFFLAVSDDDNPEGSWYFHEIDAKLIFTLPTTPGGTHDFWADYPGFAVDEEAIYICANMFTFTLPFWGNRFGGSRLWIVPKSPFYSGGSASETVYDPSALASLPDDAFTLQPTHTYGTILSGVGTFLVNTGWADGNGIDYLSIIRVDNPLGSISFANQFVSLGNIINDTSLPDAPQLGSATAIETNDGRALQAVWRNDELWGTMTINPLNGPDAGQATAHWYRINTTDTASLILLDQGNIGGEDIAANTHTFFPSLAIDANNNVAFGYAASGTNIYAGAYYTGRLAGDAAGTTQPSSVLRAGLDYYVRTFGSGRNRWGDYSGMSVDPLDNLTFWVFNQYAITRGNPTSGEYGRWGTAFGSFRLETQSVSPGDLVITEIMSDPATVSDANGEWIEIFNSTASAIDINGWTIRDNGTDIHTITNGGPLFIYPMGLLVLARNANPAVNGNYTADYQYSNFVLDNDADEVILLDLISTTIDEVPYDVLTGFPNPSGASFALRNFQSDNSSGINWTASTLREPTFVGSSGDLGSPGTLGLDQSLPVSISTLGAFGEAGRIVLRWMTESEVNNSGFIILRAISEESQFSKIASYENDSTLIGHFNSTSQQAYEFTDNTVLPGETYWYKILDVDIFGMQTAHGPVYATVLAGDNFVKAETFILYGNYPNPFNTSTNIQFRLFREERVTLTVFNAIGQEVALLTDKTMPAGLYNFFWNASRHSGLASGLYTYNLKVGDRSESRHLILLK